MSYFIAYRHTGADPEYLNQVLSAVRETFAGCGVDTYCTFFDEAAFQDKKMGPAAIMEHAFKKIESLGGLFVIIDGPEKSDGQIMEVGYCLAKAIPIAVAKRRSVDNTYIDRMTDQSFVYDDLDSLKDGIKRICEEN